MHQDRSSAVSGGVSEVPLGNTGGDCDALFLVLARYPYSDGRVRSRGGRCGEGDIEGSSDRPEGSA
jgi:hypothetical protein